MSSLLLLDHSGSRQNNVNSSPRVQICRKIQNVCGVSKMITQYEWESALNSNLYF
jgi:hypothetical protein